MELSWLKYFYEVAKTQSVTQASGKLRVSQPAVTKMIKQLEGSLGYPLFRKSGRSIRLTSDGQQLLQMCHPIFTRLSEIPRMKSSVDYQSDEVIRMGASDNLCNYVLPSCMQKFKARFPHMQWSIYSGGSSEIKAKILSGELDFGIFYTRLSLREKLILDEKVVGKVAFRAVYHPQFGKFKSVADFNRAELAYIGVRMMDYQQTTAEHWFYNRLKLKVRHSIQVNSKETQKRMVLKGLGYAILPEFMVAAELKSGKLIELKTPKEESDLILVTRKHEEPSLNAQHFLSHFFKL